MILHRMTTERSAIQRTSGDSMQIFRDVSDWTFGQLDEFLQDPEMAFAWQNGLIWLKRYAGMDKDKIFLVTA